jgi:hypothetical protein
MNSDAKFRICWFLPLDLNEPLGEIARPFGGRSDALRFREFRGSPRTIAPPIHEADPHGLPASDPGGKWTRLLEGSQTRSAQVAALIASPTFSMISPIWSSPTISGGVSSIVPRLADRRELR